MAKLTKQMLERAQTLLGARRDQLYDAWKRKNPEPPRTKISFVDVWKTALKDRGFKAKLLKAAEAQAALCRPGITASDLSKWFPGVAALYNSPYDQWCTRGSNYCAALIVRARRLLDEALFKDMDSEVLLQAIDDFNDNGIEV